VMAILEEPAAAHTVESLAACAGMSRASFSDRFTQAFRQSPMDFVQKVRLRIAARLLTTTDLPVKVVCASIGYASRSAFTRAFRSAYGVDPKTFRSVGGHEEGEPEPIEDEASRHAASGSG
jgi:AraC family transcriptional regulator, activator of mtrCDE